MGFLLDKLLCELNFVEFHFSTTYVCVISSPCPSFIDPTVERKANSSYCRIFDLRICSLLLFVSNICLEYLTSLALQIMSLGLHVKWLLLFSTRVPHGWKPGVIESFNIDWFTPTTHFNKLLYFVAYLAITIPTFWSCLFKLQTS